MNAILHAPKGQHEIAQGNALGKPVDRKKALKGRNLRLHGARNSHQSEHVSPFQGSNILIGQGPRAMPWAISLRPFRAQISNPLQPVPSPRRQLGSEPKWPFGGEKARLGGTAACAFERRAAMLSAGRVRVRVRGKPKLAAGFAWRLVAICQ